VLEQVGVDEDAELGEVPDRGHTADRVARLLAYEIGVDPLALESTGGERQLALVELVDAAHIRQHDLAVDGEDQALDDLGDVAPDRVGGVDGGLGALREAMRLDLEPQLSPGVDHASDVAMNGGLDVTHARGP
jgi:hypothetical protein